VRVLAAALSVLLLACPASGAGGELDRILRRHQDKLGPVVEQSEELRLQLVLATVVEREDGPPVLERSSWRADAEYFYPASAIKLCAAVGVLECVEQFLEEVPLSMREHSGLKPGDRPGGSSTTPGSPARP
jgi:hypothetical protein